VSSPGKGRVFKAAFAAAEGRLWLRDGHGGDFDAPLYRTQSRWIDRCCRLLGLSSEVDEAVAETIGRSLGVTGLEHARARRGLTTARGLVERGITIVGLLAHILLDATVGARLLAAGYRAGVWGTPSLWSPRLGHRLFPGSGTVALGLAQRPP
jgi:hypothetical protein